MERDGLALGSVAGGDSVGLYSGGRAVMGAPQADGLSPTVEPAGSLDGFATSIPSADNAGPDWFEVAKAMANAIMFQRGTRGEHVVGRDGRTRMGMVDLFGCYIVDAAAREFCELAGIPFGEVETPNEHQAFYMSVTGRQWPDWFTDRAAIIDGAGPSPGKGKVNLKRIAQAIEARSAMTAGHGPQDESAVACDAPEADR